MSKKLNIENPFLRTERSSLTRRLILASIAGFGVLVLLCFGAGYAYHAIHGTSAKFLSKLENKLGTKVKIGKRDIGMDEIVFSDVELTDLGHSKIDEIRFKLGFGESNGLPQVKSAEIKISSLNLHTSDTKLWASRLQDAMQAGANDPSEHGEIQWFLTTPDTIRFQIQSITVKNTSDRIVTQIKDLKGRLEKGSGLLDIMTESLVLKEKDFKSLKLSAYSNQKTKAINFRVSQTSGEQLSNLSISGNYDGVNHSGSMRGRIFGGDIAKLPLLGSVLSADEKKGSAQFQLNIEKRQNDGSYGFVVTGQGERLRVFEEHLAKEPIGPLSMGAKVTGSLSLLKNKLVVDNAALSISSPTVKINPIDLVSTGEIAWAKGDLISVQAQVRLPETSCKSLLALDPQRLTPSLSPFDVDGTMSANGSILFEKQLRKPAQVQLTHWQFGCSLAALSDNYSKERLAKSAPLLSAFQAHSKYKMLYPAESFVPLQNIPQKLIKIFLASEDISFYQHEGIDAGSIASALARNVSTDKRMLGGSTITMQVAKNLFLTQERTAQRKFQELFLTKYLEDNLSKQRILEMYFNMAEFGPGVYGVGNASKHLFGKDLANLSALEITYLATLLPAPVRRYQYFCQNFLSANMQQLVMQKFDLMHKLSRIDDEEYESGIHEQIVFDHEQRSTSPHCPIPQQQAALDHDTEDTAVF